MKAIALIASVLASLAFAGCAAQQDGVDENGTSEDALAAKKLTEGTFKLYNLGVGTPSTSCQVYTQLTLTNNGARRPTAKLIDAVEGRCRLAVAPNPREFTLTVKDVGCGSFEFTGERRVRFSAGGVNVETGRPFTDADNFAKIVINDHRTRSCRDRVEGPIVVSETNPGFPGPITMTMRALSATSELETLVGTVNHVMGIGGETTGVGFAVDGGGSFELVVNAEQRAAIVEGRKARVIGSKTTLSGVETRNRPAIQTKRLLVCPAPGTWYNMMPGPRPPMTIPSPVVDDVGVDRDVTWELANCPDVNAAF